MMFGVRQETVRNMTLNILSYLNLTLIIFKNEGDNSDIEFG